MATFDSGHFEPKVGLGLIVVKAKKVLVGVRRGSHAAGLTSFPGGKLEWNESWEAGCRRELKEECGDKIKVSIRPFNEFQVEFFVTNDIMPQYHKHFITIFLVADWVDGEPINAEPEKCDGWTWVDYDHLAWLSQHEQLANWIPMHRIRGYRAKIGI